MSFVDRRLINRDYARLWYGQAVSTVGDMIFNTTLVLWVATVLGKGKTWAPFAVSGIAISVGVAVMAVGPLAGVFVDRWNRGTTMLRTETVRAVMVGALAVIAFLPTHSLPVWLWLVLIYAVVFGVNAAEQFFNPARFVTIGDVVTGDVDRTRAFGISQATTAVAAIIGPPIAAPLLFTVGLQWALVANAASYVVSYAAIRSLHLDPAPPEHTPGSSVRREFVAGLRMFAANRYLVAILTLAVTAQLGTGALNTLDVFFLTDNLHSNSHLFGFIATAGGAGAIIGALVAGSVVARIGARSTTWIMVIVAGIVVVVFARQTIFIVALVAFFFVTLPATVLNTSLNPMLLAATPREYLGRMMAVFNPINTAASMLSVVVSGWLASTVLLHFHANIAGVHIGRIDTIFTIAGLLIVAAGVYAAFSLPKAARPTETTGGHAVAAEQPAEVIEFGPAAVPPRQPTETVVDPLTDPAEA
ncbi:MAG TPA: MFS transporter [Micromonosporaceae bacterium]|nr:MFS transporter [Micromonosporaceae bacterium]